MSVTQTPLLLLTTAEQRNADSPVPVTPSDSVEVRDGAWWLARGIGDASLLLSPDGSYDANGPVIPNLRDTSGVEQGRYGSVWVGQVGALPTYAGPVVSVDGLFAGGTGTIMTRFRITNRTLSTFYPFAGMNQFRLRVAGDSLGAYIGDPPTNSTPFDVGAIEGEWMDVALVADNGVARVFLGGVKLGEIVYEGGITASSLSIMTAGAAGAADYETEGGVAYATALPDSEAARISTMPRRWEWGPDGTIAAPLAAAPATLLIRTRDGETVTTHHVTLTDGAGEAGGATVTYDGTTLTIGTDDEVEVVGVLAFDAPLSPQDRATLDEMTRWRWWDITGEYPSLDRFIPYANPGSYGITTELWRADRYGNLIEQIDPSLVEAGTVSMNEDMTPKRRLAIDVLDPYAFMPLHDWLVPVVALSDPEGNIVAERQGLYLVVPPETVAAPSGVTGTVQGLDGTQLLHMATRDDAVIEAGTDRGAFARQLAYEVGFLPDQVRIPDIGVLQPETRRFDPGSTVYSIMSDVLSNSNYYAPWANQDGIIVTAPYLPLTSASPVWTYRNTNDLDALDLEGVITESPDWQRLANKVTVRRMGSGDTPTLSATARNENVESPSSIPALGYEISRPLPIDMHDAGWQDATDEEIEAALQAHAEAVLSEAASLYRKITVQTFPSLNADVHQVIGLDIQIGGRQVYDGRWWRTGWTLTLDGGNSTFTSNLARVEEWKP